MHPEKELVFVYNLDKGSLSDIKNYQYSSSPAKAPPCNLCALILSPVGMKKGWKRFVSDLGIPASYLYRDEFGKQFGLAQFAPPGVFIQLGGSLILIASADEINRCATTDELIDIVRERIQKYIPQDTGVLAGTGL